VIGKTNRERPNGRSRAFWMFLQLSMRSAQKAVRRAKIRTPKNRRARAGSHKEVCLWYVGLLRCKQIIIADRKSAGDCFILFDKLEFS